MGYLFASEETIYLKILAQLQRGERFFGWVYGEKSNEFYQRILTLGVISNIVAESVIVAITDQRIMLILKSGYFGRERIHSIPHEQLGLFQIKKSGLFYSVKIRWENQELNTVLYIQRPFLKSQKRDVEVFKKFQDYLKGEATLEELEDIGRHLRQTRDDLKKKSDNSIYLQKAVSILLIISIVYLLANKQISEREHSDNLVKGYKEKIKNCYVPSAGCKVEMNIDPSANIIDFSPACNARECMSKFSETLCRIQCLEKVDNGKITNTTCKNLNPTHMSQCLKIMDKLR